ncbi:MAG: hypothetical protein IKS69_05005 [Erysipelotrichaceae bacterium]|nr:hypothetical protein [Erysipelotrichaceae bacterium]MBR4421874.1 hypothetical protein [Erysipelotrichaceae bacterium]
MISISGPHIDDIVAYVDGNTIDGVTYKYVSKMGIKALFETDCEDEDALVEKKALKKDLKAQFPALMLYVQKEG